MEKEPMQKLYSRTIALKDVKEFLDKEGLKIEMFKLIANAYKTSWHKNRGVSLEFGNTTLRIGPEEKAEKLSAPSMHKLNLMDHNGAAIYALVLDWRNSPLRTKGLVFLVDDILIRIGPMKDPLVIRPEKIPSGSTLEESTESE